MRQYIGYGYFLNHALQQLNKTMPDSPALLIGETSKLLLNPVDKENLAENLPEQERNADVFLNCLPDSLRTRLGIRNSSYFTVPDNLTRIFGPIADANYGVLWARCGDHRKKMQDGHKSNITPIKDHKNGGIRSYYSTLVDNYGLNEKSLPTNTVLSFDYENLELMKILFMSPEHKYQIMFQHPDCDWPYLHKLIDCIEPLLKQLDAPPASPVRPHTSPPQEKLDAMATIYWLFAQSTPPARGGSAFANVILEHMAYRLRRQGYDYEVPYTREGVDLWAQAATLPLEDKRYKDGHWVDWTLPFMKKKNIETIKGFKARFKEGLFFDPQAKDEDIEFYLSSHQRPPRRIPIPARQSYQTNKPHQQSNLIYFVPSITTACVLKSEFST